LQQLAHLFDAFLALLLICNLPKFAFQVGHEIGVAVLPVASQRMLQIHPPGGGMLGGVTGIDAAALASKQGNSDIGFAVSASVFRKKTAFFRELD
jgi:hypothetical protein